VFSVPAHGFHDTVRKEFEVLVAAKLDSRERIEEQLKHYETHYPQLLGEKPYWTGIIARTHNNDVKNLGHIWSDHVLRYSRRDQLSFNIAVEESGLQVKRLNIGNHESEFHHWPIFNNRDSARRISDIPDFRDIAEEKSQELDLVSKELFHAKLKLNQIYNSKSWKVTRPLRNIDSQILKVIRLFKSK
jgi:hypothetical protein